MINENEQINSLEGEREMPNVNQSKSSAMKRGAIFAVLIVIVLLAVSVGVFKYKAYVAEKEETAKTDSKIKSTVPEKTFSEIRKPKVFEQPKPAVTQAIPAVRTAASAPVATVERPVVDKSASSLMVVEEAEENTGNSLTKQASPREGQGALGGMLSGTVTKTRSASFIGDRNYILPKGRFINCVLNTRLDSTVAGMTSCTVTRNVYSDNGKVLLVERGSDVTGEYKSNMKQGMARIFVLWTRIKTPNGVVVALDSPGADQLGGSGLPGYIDTHFWDRFGGAILLSMVDDVAAYVTNKADDSDDTISFENTQEASQEMAAEALKNSINIPPTLYKNQGEEIGIYVARDMNFAEVYSVGPSE